MRPDLVVLAAGMARRYGSLKQLDPVGPAGEALLDYGLLDAARAGFGRVVLVVRADIAAPVATHVEQLVGDSLPVHLVEQAPPGAGRIKPWGTGHAVLAARPLLTGSFAVMNADDWYGPAAFLALAARLARAEGEHLVVGYPLEATLSPHGGVSRAVIEAEPDGLVRRLTEIQDITRVAGHIRGVAARTGQTAELSAGAPVSMNLWGFRSAIVERLAVRFAQFAADPARAAEEEFRLSDAVAADIAAGARLRLVPATDAWFGLTFAADRAAVVARLAALAAAGIYPVPLTDGFTELGQRCT